MFELHEKVDEDGLDALLANYDPTTKKKKPE